MKESVAFRGQFGFLLTVLAVSGLALSGPGQTPRDFAIDLQANVSTAAPPHITLSWSLRQAPKIMKQNLYRRLKGETNWNAQVSQPPFAVLGSNDTSFADFDALPGVEYEYWLQRTFSGLSPSPALGYLSAGAAVPMRESRGTLLLTVDDTVAEPLAPEIAQLRRDLTGDGWNVKTLIAQRAGSASQVKAQIQTAYGADPLNVKAVYLLGHVPVPYSGSISPDGHGDHNGAWPADSYYGDMNGTWTDTSVSNTTSSGTRNDNVPGDGKFDQSSLPSALELMVGRVDLHSMTKAPSAAATEIMLLRRYLRKAHDFRHKRNAYASIPRRGILRDGFGQFGSEAFAISGWSWIFTAVGTDVDTPLSNQWFLPEYAGGKDYLVGYGNGGGNYESASSVGSSTDFGIRTSRVVFTSLFGSYFGDWDANNDFLRAPLAGNATGDSLGLTCFWGGRPARFTHHTGMGETVGYSAMVSQNSTFWGSNNNYQPNSYSGVHPGLMGDPALRLHVTEPPRNLTAQSANSRIELRWDASTEVRFEGHLVYRAPSEAGPFTRLTADPLPVPAFTDTTVAAGSAYTYQVRTLALEQAPGGSYVNPSVGVFITLTANASASAPPRNPGSLGVTPVRSDSALLSWADLSEDETGFRIERQTDAAGTFVSLATVGPDVTTFHDPGPFAHGHTYRYRVAAVNAAGDSPFSEEAAFDAVAGHFDLPVTRAKVAKTAGGVQITVNRFGGANGAVTLNYATANTTAYAGTHYTAVNGTLRWADGEVGPQSITVPILETPEPNPARQFTLTVSGNSAGTGITANNRISVLIEDAAASLPSPWTASLVGSVTDYSSAVLIGETFHSVVIGGSGVTSGTTDNGRFIHQSRSGDGILTAFLPSGLPSDGNARVALMVRATTANNAIMAAAVASSSSSFGAKLAYRTTTGGSAYALPTSSNALLQPCWLRLTRTGPLFTAEASADGTDWIQLGTISAPAMPATALWGIFHLSSNNLNYHLASVENLTLADLPTPAAPQGLTATSPTPATVSLIWEAVPIASGYRIERRGEGGEFELLAEVTATATATQTYTDASCAADTAYAYRVTALNASGAGQPSETAVAVTPQPYIVTLHTTDDPGGADARIQRDRPDTPLGNDALLAVEGYFYYDDEVSWTTLTNASKTYLRFPLGELAGIATAQLKLRFVDSRFLDFYGNYDLFVALLNDSSDEWDENTITWRNAPQNYTNAYGFLPGFLSVGGYRKSTVPAPGESIAIDLEGETLFDNCGTNRLVTLVLYQFCAASTLWAAREHPDYAPPTLELATVNPLPRRTAFLTATRGLLWSVELTWQDGGATETGFELERSVNGGAFGLLQTLPAGTTAFTDDATQPDTHYTYRVRAINAAGASSWSPSVSATTPDFYHASGTVWDGGGAEPAFDEPANWDRDALPSFDGSAYLNFAVAGDEARVNQPIALYGLSLHHANPFALTDDGGLLTLGAAGLRAANPNPGGPLEYAVSARVALAADQTWTVTNNAGAGATSLTVSGPVSDAAGPHALTKAGDGLLTLAGPNTYEGPTAVAPGGTLRVAHDLALGTPDAGTDVPAGARLEIAGGVSVPEPLTLAGEADALAAVSGSNVWSGPVALAAATRVAAADGASLTFTGGFGGGGNLTLAPGAGGLIAVSGQPVSLAGRKVYARGSGVVALAAAGSAWDTLEVSGPTLRLDAPDVLPASRALLLGSVQDLNAVVDLNGHSQTVGDLKRGVTTPGPFRLVTSAAPATLTVAQTSSSTVYYNGQLMGALSLVKAGVGTLHLSGTNNTFSGAATVSGGTLEVNAAARLGFSPDVTVTAGLLKILGSAALDDGATLRIEGGKVSVAAGCTDAVGSLILNGRRARKGTWGASGSNADYVDNDHFTGTGSIRVLHPLTSALLIR